MAKFELNNGNELELIIPSKYNSTKLYISLKIIPNSNDIKIAGFSIINCLYFGIEKVIFTDYPLTYSKEIYEKILFVEVDVSKFKVITSDKNAKSIPVDCVLIIEAGDNLLEEYSLSDKDDCSEKSVFQFKIKFKSK